MDFPSTSASAAPGGANFGNDDDELDGFDDFTIASSWEKVIATVEATARDWQATGSAGLIGAGAVPVVGSRSLHRVHKEISFGKKPYVVIYFFHVGSESEIRDEWPIGLHHLQLWFGVRDFVVIVPVTHSGVIFDPPEATTLLSTVAIALSSCGSDWPAFVPVLDATRKAYKGVQGTNSSYSITFEADRIENWVPVRFMHLEGLYELFVSKVAFTAASSAAAPALKAEFTMRLTYRTPMFGYQYQNRAGASPTAEAKPDHDGESPSEPAWDEDLPWGEWHSVEDPIKGFELIAIWNSRFVNSPYEMAEYENASTFEADKWSLIPVFVEKKDDKNRVEEGFAGRLEALVNAFYVAGEAQFMDDFSSVVKPEMDLLLETATVPPPSVLERVLKDLFYEALIPAGDGFSFRPHGTSIKGAPRDSLFGRFTLQALRFGTCNIRAISELWLEFVREVRFCWDECQPLPRISPEEPPDHATCLLHQKLQLLAACIKLKAEEVALKGTTTDPKHFDEVSRQSVEGTSSGEQIEKQNVAARKSRLPEFARRRMNRVLGRQDSNPGEEAFHEALPSFPSESSQDEMESLFNPPPQVSPVPRPGSVSRQSSSSQINPLSSRKQVPAPQQSTQVQPEPQPKHMTEDKEPWEAMVRAQDASEPKFPGGRSGREDEKGRRGSAGRFKDVMLLNVNTRLHIPLVQKSPMMTEDMLLERERAIAALSKSPSEKVARMRLQTDILASDMAAFKAANPGAVFEDFVRWHSPRDWVSADPSHRSATASSRSSDDGEVQWPPQGRLSDRMSQEGNVWNQIWENVSPEPASEQRPLFDYKREGEKVLHYLDTLRPQQLLAQMLCTAFMASADALKRTNCGDMSQLRSNLKELFANINAILEPVSELERTDMPSKEAVDAWREKLSMLCKFFGRIEADVFIAASLFQKLKLSPNVMTALFDSFLFDGERLTSARVLDGVGSSREGAGNERESVAELFATLSDGVPTGKSQRMGNYLNGIEPDVREVKFHCYEEDLRKRWNSSRKERVARSKTFSHRMYVCGTSSDLQVALSVVSRD